MENQEKIELLKLAVEITPKKLTGISSDKPDLGAIESNYKIFIELVEKEAVV